jgi:hypothetical protein
VDTRLTGNEWGSDRSTVAYTSGTILIPCRLEYKDATELPDKTKGLIYNAAIFFTATIDLDSDSRIRVVKHGGRTLSTPITFAIVGVEKLPHTVKYLCSEVKGKTVQ